MAAFPLMIGGELHGVLVHFSHQPLPDELVEVLGAFVALVTTCLNDVELFTREQSARADAEAAQQRLGFLAEASALLASSLDYQTTLKSVARLAVPFVADRCVIDSLEDDGSLRRLAAAHADAEKERLLYDMRRRYPVGPARPHPVSRVLQTGEPQLVPDVTDSLLEAIAHDTEHMQMLRRLGFTSMMIVPLRARGGTLGALTLVSSESGRHYGESDLELAEDLAQRAALAVDNARLYEQAQEAIQARDEFLSIASHELKTPLTSLQAYVQMLLRSVQRGQQPTLEQLERRLEGAEQASKRLVKLINGLLDVSRISAGRLELELEAVDLTEVTREVAERFEQELAEGGCLLELGLEGAAGKAVGRWDRFRIEQVVTNLLANAIKYGPGKPIEVRVEADGGKAQLVVRDRGIGIAPEQIERIFGQFERAVSARHYGGLGLGLFIVRQIVEAHGGEIRVESRPREGSTFTVELPLAGAGSQESGVGA